MNRLGVVVLLFFVAMIAGCAARGPGPSAYIKHAEDALAEGNLARAVTSYSYAIGSSNQEAREIALARLREARLQAALAAAIKEIAEETAVAQQTREAFAPEFLRRAEVRAHFALNNLTTPQQFEFANASWTAAQAAVEKSRADRLAAKQRADEEERERAAKQARDDADAAARLAREAKELAELREQAEMGSYVRCLSELECRKAFQLAQVYVSTKSDMKIQLATDTIIETYNPTERNRMGAKVIKMPGAGQSAEILFTITCRECMPAGERLRLVLMAGFRPFIESNLRR